MSMNRPKYRAGIVGAGYISSYHADAIARQPDAELVAICDTNEQAARRLAAGVKDARVFTDYGAMLEQADLDVVHVLTQPDSHLALTRQALEAGRDAIVEKPVTAGAAEALELREIAAATGRRIAVNHNFVFSRPFNQLLDVLGHSRLGPLKSVRVVWRQMLPQMYSGPWNLWMLRDPKNILFESGAHSLSELLAVIDGVPEIEYVAPRLPRTLPSGSEFFRRWSIAASRGDIAISIDIASDQGYPQHYIEVEGLFGVARADIGQDVFIADLPTGRLYDAERLHANLRAGLSRAAQGIRTYANFAGSKIFRSWTGSPYETSMRQGIANCYAELSGNATRRESSIDYAVAVAETANSIAGKMPTRSASDRRPAAVVPPVAREPSADCKVLIVGATGFIGRRLFIELQKQGIGVRGLVRNASRLAGVELNEHSEIIVGDFRDSELMQSVLDGIETVFHLAIAHGKSLEEYRRLDVDPTLVFARQCQQKGVKRFVYTGTIDSLDLGRDHRIREADGLDKRLSRRNNYAHSKGLVEQRLLELHANEGFPVVIVRPAIVLGAGGPVTHLGVANWFGAGSCAFWGKGTNLIPAVLVDDIVTALISIMRTPGIDGHSYNLSAEPCITARDYVEEIEKALDVRIHARSSSAWSHFAGDFLKWCVKVVVKHPDRTRIPSLHDWKCREQHAAFDTSAAQRELHWHPVNDRATIIEKGVHEPARLVFED
jgi:nucleoside-diphosphate-sugar epimerase/predicted dehydrogenase